MNFTEQTQKNFNEIADFILGHLQKDEQAHVSLHAEESLFIRFNGNKVRQNTSVEQRNLDLLLQKEGKSSHVAFTISGNTDTDKKRAQEWLEMARKECAQLPVDPYQVPLKNNGTSEATFAGHLLHEDELIATIIQTAAGSDLAGIYCGGALITANKNSLGQSHWFANTSFFLDYSLYLGEKAVKSVYAGSQWDQKKFVNNLQRTKSQLELMNRPKKVVPPGAYRTYLAPAAVAELSLMLEWGALSLSQHKQGNSGFQRLINKEVSLSPLFKLRENFGMGLTPRFNYLGEVAPEKLDLIAEGRVQNLLVSSRSAKEYQAESNAADGSESPRAMEILPGTLPESEILKKLDTGLYLSNLHYLNWSDRTNARITGMTRYACFWVENGEIVAPIQDLRFDESLYDCLGSNLLAVTDFAEIEPHLQTYEKRGFGGKQTPGFLIQDFKFTL